MKIAIIIIATAKYTEFVPALVQSSEKYFNLDDEKHYFIFTDDVAFGVGVCNDNLFERLHFYEIEHKPWPYVTLERFETIYSAHEDLQDYDFILYIDADMEFVQDVDLDLSNIDILAVRHPARHFIPNFWPVESNENSAAYLNPNEVGIYCQGCLWGACKGFFDLINFTLKNNVSKDLKNNIVARWHDESHLNSILVKNDNLVRYLHSGFAYPENWNLNIEKFIIHKDKNMDDYPRFEGIK